MPVDAQPLAGPFKVEHHPDVTKVEITKPYDLGTMRVIVGPNGEFAITYGERSEANARLIAASEKLLAACQLWDQGFTNGEEFTHDQFLRWVNANRKAAREAIALATTPPDGA